MIRTHAPQNVIKLFLILVAAITTIITGCGPTQNPVNNQAPSFQLFIFSGRKTNWLSYEADQSAYKQWLNHVYLGDVEFEINSSSVSSSSISASSASPKLLLELNTTASNELVQLLEPNAKLPSILNGEYSLGCGLPSSTSQMEFVIVVHLKPAVGGILRCPTQLVYTIPEMYASTKQGKVHLEISNTTKPIYEEIIANLPK